LQQCYFDKPIWPGAQGNASNFSSREWERVMLDLVVTHWFRVVSAFIGGRAGLKAAEDARRAAEAKAFVEARRAAKAKAAEDARRAAEVKAAKEPRGSAKAKPAKEARGGAKGNVAKEPRRAEAKAAEDGARVAKSKAADGAQSAAATHPGKRPEEMPAPPADLKGFAEAGDTTCLAEANAADNEGKMIPCARASGLGESGRCV
jgi:hypothetical protein